MRLVCARGVGGMSQRLLCDWILLVENESFDHRRMGYHGTFPVISETGVRRLLWYFFSDYYECDVVTDVPMSLRAPNWCPNFGRQTNPFSCTNLSLCSLFGGNLKLFRSCMYVCGPFLSYESHRKRRFLCT